MYLIKTNVREALSAISYNCTSCNTMHSAILRSHLNCKLGVNVYSWVLVEFPSRILFVPKVTDDDL